MSERANRLDDSKAEQMPEYSSCSFLIRGEPEKSSLYPADAERARESCQGPADSRPRHRFRPGVFELVHHQENPEWAAVPSTILKAGNEMIERANAGLSVPEKSSGAAFAAMVSMREDSAAGTNRRPHQERLWPAFEIERAQ